MEKSGAEYYICRTCHCRAGLEEPKVCSPFSRIYYIVDGGHPDRKRSENCPEKKGSVWLVPAGMTFGYFCESSMEQLFFI